MPRQSKKVREVPVLTSLPVVGYVPAGETMPNGDEDPIVGPRWYYRDGNFLWLAESLRELLIENVPDAVQTDAFILACAKLAEDR